MTPKASRRTTAARLAPGAAQRELRSRRARASQQQVVDAGVRDDRQHDREDLEQYERQPRIVGDLLRQRHEPERRIGGDRIALLVGHVSSKRTRLTGTERVVPLIVSSNRPAKGGFGRHSGGA